jgi:hypothetical protein
MSCCSRWREGGREGEREEGRKERMKEGRAGGREEGERKCCQKEISIRLKHVSFLTQFRGEVT